MTPPSERIANVAAPPRDPDTDRLLHGRLHEPRLVLGTHERGDGRWHESHDAYMEQPDSIVVTIPPLGGVVLVPE
jgi:hypothetical protein